MNSIYNSEFEALAERAAKRNNFGAVINDCNSTSSFVLWAPAAAKVELALYESSSTLHRETHVMQRENDGSYVLEVKKNLTGFYYTYLIQYANDDRRYEIIDPWAKASGPNSKRGLILEPGRFDPPGFRTTPLPPPVDYGRTVIYELSIRDYTSHPTSGVAHPGMYLGLTESGTTCDGLSTGIDHLSEMGVTHVQLMPVQDFITTNELTRDPYNWGYDTVLFDVPEGSYSGDPHNGKRILELKSAIHALHQKGMRVVLDVVYNHTYEFRFSSYQRMAPNYFYRVSEHGFSNGSGCGNEMATERFMVRKRIMDSLHYWLEEYRVDGFRFDLMGLFDNAMVQGISKELLSKRPDLLVYGEPWTAAGTILPDDQRFCKGRQRGLGIAIFEDDYKNRLLGSPNGASKGYIQNQTANPDPSLMYELLSGICASVACAHHPGKLADSPSEIIHYLVTHDNLILRDKLEYSLPDSDEAERLDLTCLAFNILMSSFGIPLIHCGTEFNRTKFRNDNSYNAGDAVNSVCWTNKSQYRLLNEHVKSLITFRLESGLFSMKPDEIRRNMEPIDAGCLAYRIKRGGEQYDFYHNPGDVHLVLQNMNRKTVTIILDGLKWYPDAELPIKVPAKGTLILKYNNI
jgi:pullulanase